MSYKLAALCTCEMVIFILKGRVTITLQPLDVVTWIIESCYRGQYVEYRMLFTPVQYLAQSL